MIDLSNKTAVITGAGSGIGRATAKLFAQAGARIIAADINLDGARATAAAIGEACTPVALDVTTPEGWSALNTALGETPLDCFVNCAGIGLAGNFEDFPLEEWNALIAVNLTGSFLGNQFAMRRMRPRNAGVIINITSVYAETGAADTVGYCASKGGVSQLTKAAAMHAGQHCPGVRVVSVAPTYVDSEMLDPVAEAVGSRDALLAGMASLVPAGRVATPADVAQGILFLASDYAAMVSGSTLFVDGAQLAGLKGAHAE